MTVIRPLALNGLTISVGSLLAQNNIPTDIIPVDGEEFWLGGASRTEQKLFTEKDVDGDGEKDIITVNENIPDIPKFLNNPLIWALYPTNQLQILDALYGISVHTELLNKMVDKFDSGKPPFDGSIDGLEKKKCSIPPLRLPSDDLKQNWVTQP